MMISKKNLRQFNEKFDDSNLINDNVNLKFKLNINIDFSKRSSQSL